MRYLAVFFMFCVMLSTASGGRAAPPDQPDAAYDYLNTLREQSGLPPLQVNRALQQAAEDHARYLTRHKGNAHRQRPGLAGFTGKVSDDRAVAAGYPSRAVSENISLGQRNFRRSIDDLMSALYHRFGFLDGTMTELGIGQALGAARQSRSFVYLMGNQYLRALCAGSAASTATFPQGYYDQVCADGRRVDALQWEAATLRPERDGPDIVLWPPRGSDHVLPAFYDESPDPLPHHKVSGALITVQFNPLLYPQPISVQRFDLWDQVTGRKLPPIVLLQQSNDPNKKLTAQQFALAPHDRLHWGRGYRAEFEYQYAGSTQTIRWNFTTRALPYPVIRVAARGGRYALTSAQTTALVIAPGLGRELYRDVRWTPPRGMRVSIDWEDDNTLLVKLRGKPCAEVLLRFTNGFRLTLVEQAAGAAADACGVRADVSSGSPRLVPLLPAGDAPVSPLSLPGGNQVQGKGEVFTVRSGQRYVFTVRQSMVFPTVGKVKYRASDGVSVQLESLDDNSLALSASGNRGGSVTLDLGDGRYFKVVLQ